MTSVPWIQSAWGEVLSAHRRSCHWGGKPEESWEKMIVMDNFCTPLHTRSPQNWSLSPFHPCPWVTTILDKSSPEEWRWLSLNKKLFSTISLRCFIQKLDPNCHHRHVRWLVTRSDNGVDRGRKYFEKQKGTEPRRETEGDRASPHFHNLGCSQQKATLHLLAMQCNALQCNARANYAQTIGYNETLRITQYFECIMLC